MPSTKDPNSVVNPGPGRLPADSVPASALLFISGAGSDAALQAHLVNPKDAHMAGAIGIPAVYPATGESLLFTSGGVIDGESVLDFINQFKDLLPVRPNFLGFNLPTGINSGIPSWGNLNTIHTGGYANGATTIPTHYIVPNGSASFALTGTIFPADRGVLALYHNTSGDFFDAINTTLVAALWLGDSPAPAGIPDAAFNETLRTGQQVDHTPGINPLDQITLTYRLPYLKSYAAYPGAPYAAYDTTFYRFQLATIAVAAQALAAGGAQNYLLVHWREGHATTLASIQPAALTALTLVAANCYSATPDPAYVPPAGTTLWDDLSGAISNVNRHHVFRDTSSGTTPLVNAFTTAPAGGGPVVPTHLSGVEYVSNTSFEFDLTASATSLYANSFQTFSVDTPPNVPTGFASANIPLLIDFGDFGAAVQRVGYFDMHPTGPNPNYSIVNAPQPGDVGEYTTTAFALPSPTPYTPHAVDGAAKVHYTWHNSFSTSTGIDASRYYLYNSYPQNGALGALSTDTYEPFVDEHYRYLSAYVPTTPTVPIVPAGGDAFDPTHVFVAGETDLQVLGHYLAYPTRDFSTGLYFPTGPDYSGLFGGDGTERQYIRAFDTGVARNTGKLRIRGVAAAAFQVNAPYDGSLLTGHTTGGMAIFVKVPGSTGWLDIGRALGDPGLATSDYYGCATATLTSGGDVFVTFQTTAFTVSNGAGKFPLFVKIVMANNAAGRVLYLDEVEWMTP